ncbi:MAG: response regulator [Verrucomicrobia bacterium]|nr:response regulator [Verrucomicrobiota bacterium]
MKILIIEDDDAIRFTLRDLLELHGHEVLAAADGEQGVALAARHPEFIFCDVSMPGMNGFEVIEAIHRRPEGRLVPFVFLTAKAERSDQRRGMALGADDYITKPFSEREILDAIASRTSRHRSVRERVEELVEQRRRELGAEWSHELLTPLNGMIGGLELLQLEIEAMGRTDLKVMLALVRAGAERQERLSRKLIRYFELERQREQPGESARTGVCAAESAIRRAVDRVVEESGRGSDLDVRVVPARVPLPEVFLTDAVAELVGNALKFSRPGQRICLRGVVLNGRYVIEVVDEGPGMTARERESVQPFRQFGRDKREQQGLGLGLAIARRVAEVGGGTLVLGDTPTGQGLRAAINLPLARA